MQENNHILNEWLEATRKTITWTVNGKELTVVYELVDVMPILMAGDASNPFLTAIQDSMSGGGGVDMQNPAIASKLPGVVNECATLAIVEPPLLEAGHTVGISVTRLPFALKMEIFSHLTGLSGGEVQTLDTFHEEPGESLVARSTGGAVRTDPGEDHASPPSDPYVLV